MGFNFFRKFSSDLLPDKTINNLFNRAQKLSDNRYLKAIRNGFTFTISIVMMGSLCTLLDQLPIESYQIAKKSLLNGSLETLISFLNQSTSGVTSVFILIGVSFSLADSFSDNQVGQDRYTNILAVLLSLSCFFGMNAFFDSYSILLNSGPQVIFMAIVVSIVATRLFILFSSFSALRIHFKFDPESPLFSKVVEKVIPFVLVLSVFILIHLLTILAGFDSNEGFIRYIVHQLSEALPISLSSFFILDFFRNAVWLLGIHGSRLFTPFLEYMYEALALQGSSELSLNIGTFFDSFVYIGGAGTTLSLTIACLLYKRKNQIYRIAKLGLIPSLFNINEIIIFGLPLIYNPFFFIPFLLSPLVLSFFNLLVFNLSSLEIINHVDWTTPALLSGYLATGSLWGSVLQLASIMLGVIIYMPFVELYDRFQYTSFKTHRSELIKQSVERIVVEEHYFTYRNDDIGVVSRLLARELQQDFNNRQLKMQYQPIVSFKKERVIGVEALIEWQHEEHGFIPFDSIVTLAQEFGFVDRIMLWQIKQAIAQHRQWVDSGHKILLTLNISSKEIAKPFIVDNILTTMERYQMDAKLLAIEVKESIDLATNDAFSEGMNRLTEKGISLVIDNFSLGHSCAIYIKKFPIKAIKVDQSLISSIAENDISLIVLEGIIQMADTLNIEVVFNYVKSHQQLQILRSLGSHLFQGSFFCSQCQTDEIAPFIESFDINTFLRQDQEEV